MNSIRAAFLFVSAVSLAGQGLAQTPDKPVVIVRPVVVQPPPQPQAKKETPAPAATPDNPFPTYSDKARGWHWKELFPEDVEPEPDAPVPPPPAPPAPQADPGPKPLSAEWLRVNIPLYLDKAVEDPTPQNISNYLYLQKFAMDAADRFSQAYRRVVLADANLDESASSPVWNGATKAMEAAADKARRSVIASLAKEWGLWFFFRSDCEPCHVQAPVLEAFARLYKFSVLPVSLDGAPLPNGPFGKKYVVDVGQAAKLGVKGTPTVLLVKAPSTIVPLSYGMSSIPELEARLIELAAEMGVITPEQYQSTRVDRKNLLPPPAGVPGLDTLNASDPDALRRHLQSLVTARQGK